MNRYYSIKHQPVSAQQGFTLIELMTVLIVASILLVIGVPSLQNFILSMRMETETQELVQALQLARSEAVRTGREITVQGTGGSSDEWSNGLSITRDNGDLIREIGVRTTTMDSALNITTIVFGADGFSDLPGTETITVCDTRSGETGRVVQILRSGIVQSSTQVCP